MVVGRAMLNLLEYIKQNYQSHFKDLKINEINAFDFEIFQQIKDNLTTVSMTSGIKSSKNLSGSLSPFSSMRRGGKNTSPSAHSSRSVENQVSFEELYVIAFPNFLDSYEKFVDKEVRQDVNRDTIKNSLNSSRTEEDNLG